MTISAVAMKRFQLRHGNPAQTLDALCPTSFPQFPVDYMDGKPIAGTVWSRRQFVLYSVGEDEQDDAEAPPAAGQVEPAKSLDRKDFVWRAAATPDEVEEYHNTETSEQ